MKKSILILAATAFTNFVGGQSIQVNWQKAIFSTGEQNALVTTVYGNTKNEVVTKWKDYLKDFKNVKVKFENEEMIGDNVLIEEWGNNPVDIYARFEENKDDKSVMMKVAFDLGGAYLSNEKDTAKHLYAEKMVKDFAAKTTRFPIELKLRSAEKLLGDMNNDLEKLDKENKDLEKDIENYKNRISKAEEAIKKNEDLKIKKKAQLDAQSKVIVAIKGEIDQVK